MRDFFRRHTPGFVGDRFPLKADMWIRCARCREMVYSGEWDGGFKVCPKCGYHGRLNADERVQLLLDPGSFEELDRQMTSADPLSFAPPGTRSYRDKLKAEEQQSGLKEACVYGRGEMDGLPVILGVLDMSFFTGTMGSVVGEKVARACELARDEHRALVICSASGGARQHEGVIALLQMAKTAAAVRALGRARTPFVSVLTDPTLAGVTASFAALGDCIIAEPGAVIGFAGPRIIEQATGERLPPGADTAEFQLQHGMVDMVVPRRELRDAVVKVIRLYQDAVNLTRPHPVQRPAAELDTVVAAG